VLLGLTAACSTTHVVRPLGAGNASINASLGGPLVQVGSIVTPVPILSLGGAYGVRDDVEVLAHADVTAAIYGDLHLESGIAYHPIVRQSGAVPILTLAGSVHVLTDVSDTRVIPQVTLAAAWHVAGKHLVYVGADNALAVGCRGSGCDGSDPQAPSSPTRYVFGPLVGGELRVGHVGLVLEMKWLAPYYNEAPTAPAWIAPGSLGYFSVLLGANYYLGDTP
jgi:hypothetical protein